MPMCFIPTCRHCNTTCKWLRFPAKVETKTKWLNNIGRFRLPSMPAKNSFICSCHFVDGKRENGPTIFSWTNKEEPITLSLDDPSHNLRMKLRQNYALIGKTINNKTKRKPLKKDPVPSNNTYIYHRKILENNETQEKDPLAMEYTDFLTTEDSTKRIIIGETIQYLGNPSSNIKIINEDNSISFVEIKNEDSLSSCVEIKDEDNHISFVEINNEDIPTSSNIAINTESPEPEINSDDSFYKTLQLNQLPLSNWGTQSLKNNAGFIFSQIELVNEIPHLRKCIKIEKNCATIYLDRKKLYTEIFHSRYDLINILCRVDNQNICPGGPLFNVQDPSSCNTAIASTDSDYNRWRHKKCIYMYDGPEHSCCFCLKLFSTFVNRQSRLKKSNKQKDQMRKMIRHKFECFKEKQNSIQANTSKEKCDHFIEKKEPVNVAQIKNTIRDKFQCIKEKRNLIPEKPEKSVNLLQLKNIIKNKFECIKENNVIDKTSEFEETVDLIRMKNIIKNKVECIGEESNRIDFKANEGEGKNVDLSHMKNIIRNKFASIKEKNNLIQECYTEENDSLLREQKCKQEIYEETK